MVATTPANAASFADDVVDSTYLYDVTAFNAGNESAQSNIVEESVGSGHGPK